jgi:hypothetical protein
MPTLPTKGYRHPALIPDNVHAMLKTLYKRTPQATALFRTVPEPIPEYRDILEKAFAGAVGDISGEGGFTKITGQFESVAGAINGKGAYFELGPEEKWWSRINLLAYHMDTLTREIANDYEIKVLNAIKNISGASTFNGTDWTTTTSGDPFFDLEKARGKIFDASGQRADVALLNETYYLYLIKFPEFREFLKLGVALLQKGNLKEILTPNGLRLVVFPDSFNTYIEDAKCIVTKSLAMGVNHETIPFTSIHREGSERAPLTDFYYGYEWKEPSIDKIDAKVTCVITGLDA